MKESRDPSVEYYTDDVTLLPIRVIWRAMRRQPMPAAFVAFLYILARKFLRRRFPANHGSHRQPRLTSSLSDDIPFDVRMAFAPFGKVCEARGMNHVGFFHPEWIGNKRGLFSIWLDPQGLVYCTIAWIDLRLGDQRRSKVVFSCHSVLVSGVELHTGPLAPEDHIPEMIPPDQDLLPLPLDTTPCDAIDRHRERITGRGDIVCHDAASLMAHLIRGSERLLDHLVAKGIYAPLTSVEVERLRRIRDG